ncbi:hypothetical protein Bca52824_017987 [Brassica carinata]|uniref:Uncharacterized protein n=1 Tax=Brassica carinata TaxID=52824 RepID=A0A8X7VQ26_BRACI|nr:hypothetical protein Bca52824_017987 [Brassica carinata]
MDILYLLYRITACDLCFLFSENGNGRDDNALEKIFKSVSDKLMSQASNQTTMSNIIGGSDSTSATLKRKRSTKADVPDSTPTSFSGKKRCSKQAVLSDITNICSTSSTLPPKLRTHFTSGSCVSKISTNGKGKLKTNTRTKSCRKILEPQFNGYVDDSSSEDEEDQAYQYDYGVIVKP